MLISDWSSDVCSSDLEQSAEWTLAETRLFKHDLEKGSSAVHDFGSGRHPGEFVFVPRNAEGAEDDGWLIGLVVDMNDETTDLVILNADDFTGSAQAVVHLPHRVPPGFHGNWIADCSCRGLPSAPRAIPEERRYGEEGT